MLTAIANEAGVLRFVFNTADEDMQGWTELELPTGFDPANGPWLVVDGKVVADTAKIEAGCLAALRSERDARLAATDWTQLADVPEPLALAFRPYRQSLRDLPETTADLLAPEWPELPAV